MGGAAGSCTGGRRALVEGLQPAAGGAVGPPAGNMASKNKGATPGVRNIAAVDGEAPLRMPERLGVALPLTEGRTSGGSIPIAAMSAASEKAAAAASVASEGGKTAARAISAFRRSVRYFISSCRCIIERDLMLVPVLVSNMCNRSLSTFSL